MARHDKVEKVIQKHLWDEAEEGQSTTLSNVLDWLGQFPNIHTYLGNNASGRTFLYLVTNGMFPVLWDLEYDFLSDQDEDLINFLERFIP